jgi:hypothetical protein
MFDISIIICAVVGPIVLLGLVAWAYFFPRPFVTRRALPVVMIAIGITLTFDGLSHTASEYRRRPLFAHFEIRRTKFSFHEQPLGWSSEDGSYYPAFRSPRQFFLVVLFGATFAVIGILWWNKRFSLRCLLLATIAVAVIACVPLFVKEPDEELAQFMIAFDEKLTDEHVLALAELMQPDLTLATVPSEYLPLFSTREILGARVYRISTGGYQGGVCCELRLRSESRSSSRRKLLGFYDYYFRFRTCQAAIQQGINWAPQPTDLTADADFEQYRKTWLTQTSEGHL